MQISLSHAGKRFQREWIFRNVSLTLESRQVYAVIGPNGSGKSTFMLTVAGMTPATQGDIVYTHEQKPVAADDVYRYLSIAAPYMELIEEFTLKELLDFHFSFKTPLARYTTQKLMEAMYLEQAGRKYIKQFSSGMKQRLKLGLAFYAQSPAMFLDEPCSNLDARGIQWYRQEIQQLIAQKTVLICSNQPYEYDFSDKIINIEQYK